MHNSLIVHAMNHVSDHASAANSSPSILLPHLENTFRSNVLTSIDQMCQKYEYWKTGQSPVRDD